ncbi:unnamed protein product [Adineta ricciae]|uniref:Geminin n=1 Tax=Adineta ricciae TaxID=249248 RepID=A0A814UYA8_ADIRI|nr:unnamed protein product [Adineta ricciae]CAF1180791.1 unnamed protein product [Adineta ricciae]
MSQKSPTKLSLLHSIENNRSGNQKGKSSTLSIPQSIGVNTEQIQCTRDAGSNTPNYAEQMARAMENGSGTEEFVQMLLQNEASEAYWKIVTERRKEAIEDTILENQQLHNLIDGLSKENDQLRVVAGHHDYLQSVLNSFTHEHDSLLDDSSTN